MWQKTAIYIFPLVHDCVIKPNLLFCPWLLNEGVGGKFYFLSIHKTLCFCLRHDGLFVGVNVFEVYLWHGHSMPLTHTTWVSLFPWTLHPHYIAWPPRVKCDAAVTNNCWARGNVLASPSILMCINTSVSVMKCHNPMSRSVTLCQFCDNRHTKTLHTYSYLLSSRARVITIKISTHLGKVSF